jgi:hypothetical protein
MILSTGMTLVPLVKGQVPLTLKRLDALDRRSIFNPIEQ